MNRFSPLVLLLAVATNAGAPSFEAPPYKDSVPRLSPDQFDGAPEAVRADLSSRGCLIPQNQETRGTGPNNLMEGGQRITRIRAYRAGGRA